MGVQAKFYVASITKHAGSGDYAEITLRVVTRGGANADWAAATPSGEIKMTVSNPPAITWFEDRLGKELALGFEDFVVPSPDDGHEFVPIPAVEGYYADPNCRLCGCSHAALTAG